MDSNRKSLSFTGWLVSFLLLLLLSAGLAGCSALSQSTGPQPQSFLLADLTESDVQVVITLEVAPDGSAVLSATYTPLEAGYHLYSKDLPPGGVDGVGRPTRLDLLPLSRMTAAGDLSESIPSEAVVVLEDAPAIPVYPAGPVTLRLPVTLPDESGTAIDDLISISYMSCSNLGCTRPVRDKIVSIQIPTLSSVR